jgi:RNA polymerase-associated protein CTR9
LKKIGIANDPVSLKALARAHYILGKTTKEPTSMRNARKLIQKAIHAFPGDKSLYFNLALIEQQFAQVLNEQSSENRSVDALKSALRDIDISANLFKFLTNVKPLPSLKYDVARAKERAAFCSTVRKVTEKKIHECEVLQRQREERLHEIREMKKEAELERVRKQQEEEELARKKEAEVDAMRKEIQAQNQEMNEKMRGEKGRKHVQDSSDEEDEQRYFIKPIFMNT